jgi:hypothetical protein
MIHMTLRLVIFDPFPFQSEPAAFRIISINHRFLFTLTEIRLKGAGSKRPARRRLNFDPSSQILFDFWKPDGKINRSNVAWIKACMKQLGIYGSPGGLEDGGTAEDHARVLSCLSLRP